MSFTRHLLKSHVPERCFFGITRVRTACDGGRPNLADTLEQPKIGLLSRILAFQKVWSSQKGPSLSRDSRLELAEARAAKGPHRRNPRKTLTLAKCFCRTKFWAKLPFWRGAVRGEVFGEVCGEVFGEVFGLVLRGHSKQTKTSAKTSAQNSHNSAQQNWRKFRKKTSYDEVLQGDLPNPYGSFLRRFCSWAEGQLPCWRIPRGSFKTVP